MTDEQRQRLKRRLRERRAQTPEGSPEWGLLTDTLFRLALGASPVNIHKINRDRRRKQ